MTNKQMSKNKQKADKHRKSIHLTTEKTDVQQISLHAVIFKANFT